MAIFSSSRKDKHKKNNSGADSGASSSAASPPIGPGGAAFPRSGSAALGGSLGRSEGSGIPVPGGGMGPGSSALYASTSSQGGPMTAPHPALGPGIPQPAHMQQSLSHPGSSSQPHAAPPPSHTVLYPWSQRPLALLPSQLLPPSSSTAPSSPLPAEPVLGYQSPPPFPRYGHSVNPVASANGDLYLFGGLVQNTVKNDLYVAHCAAAVAQAAAGSPGAAGGSAPLQVALLETRGEVPGPRVGHASVSVGNVLIVWGGDTKTRPEERQDDGLYLLNLSTREWTRVKTLGRAPEGRYGHAAAMVGSRFYVFGGQTDDGGFRNDLGWFDLQKLKQGQPRWSFVDYAPGQVVPPPRTGHTCVTHGDSLYIFGGTDGSYHYNDTWQYDLTTGQWTELACIGYIPVPREGHAATLVDDVMYVFGGRGVDGKDLEDLAAFKISNHRWFMFQNMGPAPSGRSGHAMATWQTKVLVLGGESYTSQRADDPSVVHVLDTTKIKYPPDSSRPAQQQASQPQSALPPPSGIPAPSSSINGQTPQQLHQQQQRKSSIPVSPDLRDRAASPTGSQRGLKSSLQGQSGLPVAAQQAQQQQAAGSIGQMMLNGSSNSNGANGGGAGSPPGSIGRSGIPTPSSPTGAGAGGSKIAKRATVGGGAPPTRPARPDDAEAFSAGTIGGSERAKSPTSTMRKSVVPQGSGTNLRGAAVAAAAAAGAGEGGAGAGGGNPQMANLSGFAAQQQQQQQQEPRDFHPGGGSPQIQQQQQPAPADAFYYTSSSPSAPSAAATVGAPAPAQLSAEQQAAHRAALETKDAQIAQLERREKWIVAALRGARERGFVVPSSEEEGEGREEVEGLLSVKKEDGEGYEVEKGEKGEKEKRVLEVVVALKGELAKAKSLMADQASALDDRFQGAERARSAALQEAAYYRAKLAAFESASPSSGSDSIAKLERERAAELEQKLSDALASRAELEAQVSKLEQDVAHHSTLHSSSDEQHKAVASRADAAEQSHARALADFADLQKRSHGHERSIAEHVEKLASLTSAHAILEADNQRYRSQVDEHEASLAGYLRTLEASQEALTAAQARNDELAGVWEKATSELTAQQLKVAELEARVETLQRERDAATAKADELELVLKSTTEAHDKAHALANGGLAELLAAHKERQALKNVGRSRSVGEDGEEGADVDEDVPTHHIERLRAVEGEVSTVRQLHSDAQAKSDALAGELEAVRAREVDLHHQLSTLRAQLATVQEQHSRATEELGTHKSLVAEHEQRARTVTRAKDAAEVKAGLLRSLLADHGLAAPSEEDLEAKFAPLSGDESAEQLARRVQELEARVESHSRQKEQLEERVNGHESEAERLREEVERAKAASRQGVEGEERERERAEKVKDELEQLQGRHQQLEATHLKAVQYVKGTEKMLRRMKEELTRYKERCEELDSPERQAELDTLRQQAESATQQHDDLQQRMSQLQSEYQQTLREQQQEASAKVEELTTEVGKLDQELEKAHHDLEETLAVNASLNKELQAALKNPGSPRAGGSSSTEDVSRLQAELEQASNKAEWLKRENASLEQRCRTAESKIAILLDHMESVQSDPYGSQQGSPRLDQVHNGSPGGQQHDWERRESVSDAASEYDEQPHRR
ncbi:hypothetical protein JCM6882_003297 [Rhodosporidiobolus microsporus]